MFRLNNISITQFKNYFTRSFEFTGRVTAVCGRNGVGKTNLLDAIHYLCFTKSHFRRSDGLNTLHGHEGFRLEGELDISGNRDLAVCILRESGKKEFSVNGQIYEKFSQHIGRYPCVMVAPDDIEIIINGSEERRKFIDTLLSQLDGNYLKNLIIYNKILQQRNALLKSFAETKTKDLSLLAVFDQQLVEPGAAIFETRKEFLFHFLPLVKSLYQQIAQHFENINLFYQTELVNGSFAELLKVSQARDFVMMRTTAGIHRDDLEFNLNGESFRSIASQGQRKSLLFALKLAEMETLKKEKGYAPILLLDDVFEKLDEDRAINLLQNVGVNNDGQIFITDTDGERLRSSLKRMGLDCQLIEL